MARPKGVIQKRDESKYWLPEGIQLKLGQEVNYNKETILIFVDPIFGEFESYFKALQGANASTHPKAVQKRREKTNIEKYGGTNPSHSPEIRRKAEKTMLNKYGAEHALLSPQFIEKSKSTLLKNHGIKHPMDSQEFRDKQKETCLKRYGVTSPAKATATRILPNGKNFTEYSREKGINKSQPGKLYINYGPQVAQDWIDNYKDTSSCLEIKLLKLVPELIKFEKVPEGIEHFRPDFQLNDKIYVDVDGLLYHSDLHKPERGYHQRKRKAFENAGKQIIQIHQDELYNKEFIVQSIIRAKAGVFSEKIYARKLKIERVVEKDAHKFFNETHLMGISRGCKYAALVDESKNIICCISYKKHKTGIDIGRFSTKLNTLVIGGLSRLLKYIEKTENPEFIQSFVDLRYGNGDSLKNIGYTLESVSLGFKWTNEFQTFNRLQCRAKMDERNLTEAEYAKEKGWHKIFDAGQAKFIKRFKGQ